MQRLRGSTQCLRLLQVCTSTSKVTTCTELSSFALPLAPAFGSNPIGSACANSFQIAGCAGSLGWKSFSSSTWLQKPAGPDGSSKRSKAAGGLVQQRQTADDITDQIPEIVRPMGVVEGTSYTLLIVAGLAFAAAVIWAAASELLFQSKEYTCFDITLKKLQEDPRVTVRLGTPVSGFGQDTRNRQARQRIPNRIYNDANGIEHVQIQFFARGPSGTGRVNAELYQDEAKQWQYRFLFMDMDHPYPQRLTIVDPNQTAFVNSSSAASF